MICCPSLGTVEESNSIGKKFFHQFSLNCWRGVFFPFQSDDTSVRNVFGGFLHGTIRDLGIGSTVEQHYRTPDLRQLKSPGETLELGLLTNIPKISSHRVLKIPALQNFL